jgi:hypothetical protein
MIEAEPAAAGADPELAAIEAGAQDVSPGDEDGTALFMTDPADLDLVSRALPTQGFRVLSAKLGYKAKNPVEAAQPERAATGRGGGFSGSHRRQRRRAAGVCRAVCLRPALQGQAVSGSSGYRGTRRCW